MASEIVQIKKGNTLRYPVTVGNAVMMEDNKLLPQRLNDIENKLGLQMDLLWENASPTSQFAAQTINIDLTDYNFLLFKIVGWGAEDVTTISTHIIQKNSIVPNTSVNRQVLICHTWSSSNGQATYGRTMTITNSSIAFSAMPGGNIICIPYQIYGIK